MVRGTNARSRMRLAAAGLLVCVTAGGLLTGSAMAGGQHEEHQEKVKPTKLSLRAARAASREALEDHFAAEEDVRVRRLKCRRKTRSKGWCYATVVLDEDTRVRAKTYVKAFRNEDGERDAEAWVKWAKELGGGEDDCDDEPTDDEDPGTDGGEEPDGEQPPAPLPD